jgi:hypothetical protein
MLKWIKLWHQLVKHLCPRKNVGVLRMLAEDAIKALEEALALVPPGSLENVIQKALKKSSTRLGLKGNACVFRPSMVTECLIFLSRASSHPF